MLKKIGVTLAILAVASFFLAWFAPGVYNDIVNLVSRFLQWLGQKASS